MKKLIFAAVVAAVAANPVYAQSDFFKKLYKSLTSSTAQRYGSRGARGATVAAVRGAPMGTQDPAQPYWKGGLSEQAAKSLEKERGSFASAIQLVIDGKASEGLAALEQFQKDHPKSPLMADVKEAAERAREAAATQTAAAPTEKAAGCDGEKLLAASQSAAEEEGCSQDAAPAVPDPSKIEKK